MPMHQKIITTGFAALFALVLAGCGSGSESPMTMEPTEPPLDEDELARLQEELEALRAGIRLKDEADRLQEQIDDNDDDDDPDGPPDGPDRDEAARTAWNNALWEALGIAGGRLIDFQPGLNHFRSNRNRPSNANDEPDPTLVDGWNVQSWNVTNSNNSTTFSVMYDNQGETPTPFNQRWGNDSERQAGVYALNSGNRDHRTRIELSGLPTNPNHKGVVLGPVGGQRGTFDGVEGTFLGTGQTGTEVKVNADGEPTWNASDLKFRPDNNTATVMLPDSTYMGVGLWLTENENGTVVPEYRGWTQGSWRFNGRQNDQYVRRERNSQGGYTYYTTVPGTMTFKGPAVGHYAHRTVDGTVGAAFVAEAEFVLDTEYGLSIDERKGYGAGILTGTIDNFVGMDGQPIGDGWKIETGNPFSDPFDPTEGNILQAIDLAGADGTIRINAHGIRPFPFNARATFGNVVTMGHLTGYFRDGTRNDNLPGGIEGQFDIGEENHPVRMAGSYVVVNQVSDLPDD